MRLRNALALALLVLSRAAAAQQELPPNGLLLIGKPRLYDPVVSCSALLETQAPDNSDMGVINRPTRVKHAGMARPPRHRQPHCTHDAGAGPHQPQDYHRHRARGCHGKSGPAAA